MGMIAAIRSDLEDFDFDFVQGTFLHTEGKCSSPVYCC